VNAGREAASRALHLMADVQAFGLVSAASVADRYLETVDRYLAQDPPTAPTPTGLSADPSLAEVAGRMAEACARSLDLVSTVLSRGEGPGNGIARVEVVTLPPTPPGSTTEGSVWVHNPTATPADVELRATGLVSAAAGSVPDDAVVLAPEPAQRVEPGGTSEVRIRVSVPRGTEAGHFHGLVMSTLTPAEAIPFRLEVLAADGPA
jgi:hypothetical protein